MSGNALTEGQKLTIGGYLIARLNDITRGLDFDSAQEYVEDAGRLVVDVRRGIFGAFAVDFSQWLSKWESFYKKIFGQKYDFSGISVPQGEDVFAWLICMAGDIPAEDWLSKGKNPPPFWKWTDRKLEDVLDLSFGRDGWNKQYIVRAKANLEADEDLKNLSAIQIAERKINSLGLRERLALGRFLYWDKEVILDRNTLTLCADSRYSDGDVPDVDFNLDDGWVDVYWYNPDNRDDSLRVREAVS